MKILPYCLIMIKRLHDFINSCRNSVAFLRFITNMGFVLCKIKLFQIIFHNYCVSLHWRESHDMIIAFKSTDYHAIFLLNSKIYVQTDFVLLFKLKWKMLCGKETYLLSNWKFKMKLDINWKFKQTRNIIIFSNTLWYLL
jgi:hypothetical protein